MGESHDPEKRTATVCVFVVFSWPCVNDMKLANDRLSFLAVRVLQVQRSGRS